MIPDFTMVYCRQSIGFGDATHRNSGVDRPVVATIHAAFDFALHIGKSICQNRRAIGCWVSLNTRKAIATGREALEEVLHQSLVIAFFQHVEDEAIAYMQQRLNSAVFRHGNAYTQGFEASLRHPRRKHSTADIALLGRENVQSATKPSQSFL